MSLEVEGSRARAFLNRSASLEASITVDVTSSCNSFRTGLQKWRWRGSACSREWCRGTSINISGSEVGWMLEVASGGGAGSVASIAFLALSASLDGSRMYSMEMTFNVSFGSVLPGPFDPLCDDTSVSPVG